MLLHVIGGPNLEMKMDGYRMIGPLYKNPAALFANELKKRIHNNLSVSEIAYNLNPKYEGKDEGVENLSAFVLRDATTKELVVFTGLTRGYIGGGPRASATLDTYIGLFNIPKNTHVVSLSDIRNQPIDAKVYMRDAKKPRFNYRNIQETTRNLAKQGYELDLHADILRGGNIRRMIKERYLADPNL